MRIGVDLDGVAYDFIGAFRQYAHQRYGISYASMPQAVSWDFPVHDWGWTLDQFLDRFHQGVSEGYLFWEGAPYPGIAEGVGVLRAAGHQVHIVTHRENVGEPGTAVVNTARWLAQWGIGYDALHFIKDKTLVKVDVFIEDNVTNFRQLWKAGTPSFLRNQPYNMAEPADALWRVDSFTEFVNRVIGWSDMEAAA